jgi:hypothetical protein
VKHKAFKKKCGKARNGGRTGRRLLFGDCGYQFEGWNLVGFRSTNSTLKSSE